MKYALVTGGSRGIGRAICIKLASMGYCVIVNYVSNEAKAVEVMNGIRENGGNAELLKMDVSDAEDVCRAMKEWNSSHDGEYIEVLVNNAGIRKDELLIWMERDSWSSVLGTTLDGFYNVSRAVLQPMLLKKNGRIINVASLSGLKGMPGQVNYSAAKGGLIAATKALAQEVARKKITVNAIAPGFIKTDMVEGLDEAELSKTIPARRFGTPEEVAALVGFLVSPEAAYINGECISINGALY